MAIHGGSVRVSVAPRGQREPSTRVGALVAEEHGWGVLDDAPYVRFAEAVARLKDQLRGLLDQLKSSGARLAAYGAAAKGVTLASYCGIGANYLDFVVDRSPHKQGRRFPVDGLAILPPAALIENKPAYALLFTWNFADEILRQQADYQAAGGRFVLPIPAPHVRH
jgi:hypothetical protein